MGGPPLASVSPNSGPRGTMITLTLTLGGNPPPAGLAPSAVSVGGFACGNIHRTSTTVITATLTLPADAPITSLDVGVTFPGPVGQGDVTFSLSKGFSVL